MKRSTMVIVMLSLYAGYAAAIRCHVCDSAMNSRCGDKFEGSGAPPADNCTTCAKSKWKVQDIQFIERTCETAMGQADKCHSETFFGIEKNVCRCNKDLCNGALRVSARFSLTLGLLVILIFSL